MRSKSTKPAAKTPKSPAPVAKTTATVVDRQETIGVPTPAMIAAGAAHLAAGMPNGARSTIRAMVTAPGALDHAKLPEPDNFVLEQVSLRNGMTHEEIADAWYRAAVKAAT